MSRYAQKHLDEVPRNDYKLFGMTHIWPMGEDDGQQCPLKSTSNAKRCLQDGQSWFLAHFTSKTEKLGCNELGFRFLRSPEATKRMRMLFCRAIEPTRQWKCELECHFPVTVSFADDTGAHCSNIVRFNCMTKVEDFRMSCWKSPGVYL